MALTPEAYDAAAIQTAIHGAVRSPSAIPRPYRCYEPGVLDAVPLSVATGHDEHNLASKPGLAQGTAHGGRLHAARHGADRPAS